ncbi:MAG: glycosyltransferase family 39 protein [Deltaproteobacteria bacterium]|nr:glycosyltransferase family 39 protein [Deltaproteobacteria bacterium]
MHRAGIIIVFLAVTASYLPFVDKAFHLDDPVYLRVAHEVVADPANFYGFDINWYGYFAPVYEVNKNPPLVSFYVAGMAQLVGWSERGVHLAMLLPALGLILGTYLLARRLGAQPLVAALATWLTPVVLVSSTTVMSDVLMLALWCWAVFLWVSGLEERSTPRLIAAGLLMGLCALAKYFGLALTPLLLAYGLFRERRAGAWLLVFLIPVAIVGAYQFYVRARYGLDPLMDVAQYALTLESKSRYSYPEKLLVGLVFLGGCLLPTLLFAPLCWSRSVLAGGLGALVAGAAAVPLVGELGGFPLAAAGAIRWGVALQVVIFALAGAQIIALAAADLSRRRDAGALLLVLWVGGVWIFATFTNWTTTARAVLPAAPAVGIVIARRLSLTESAFSLSRKRFITIALVVGLLISGAVAWGDYRLAGSARSAAEELSGRYARGGSRLFFQGGWGFQHYMEKAGATRTSWDGTQFSPGDILLVPGQGSNLFPPPQNLTRVLEEVKYTPTSWISVMSKLEGAGFYASLFGPLPFVFGPTSPERYYAFRVEKPFVLKRE